MNHEHSNRYVTVMRFAYGLWTAIWVGFMAAILVFAADWGSAVTLCSIFTVIDIWIFMKYSRKVKQAVEEYTKNTESLIPHP